MNNSAVVNEQHFVERTEPHSPAELEGIEELVRTYESNCPIVGLFSPEEGMTFAELFRQRLLGQRPWMFGFDMGGGKFVSLLTTRFSLIL